MNAIGVLHLVIIMSVLIVIIDRCVPVATLRVGRTGAASHDVSTMISYLYLQSIRSAVFDNPE
jgi:hypothetical protein